MNELEDMSGFYQKMKNVETYQYLSSSRYIVGHKNPLCTVLITFIKEAKNVIMRRMIKKLCKSRHKSMAACAWQKVQRRQQENK